MNRSAANLAIFVLSLAGCFVSLILTIKYVQGADIPCMSGPSDCNAVAQDSAAWGLGIPMLKAIPTPALGLLMYAVLSAVSMARVLVAGQNAALRLLSAQRLIGLFGVGISAYLTWREAAVIHHWCVWCLGSAAIILCIFIAACSERYRILSGPRREGLEAA